MHRLLPLFVLGCGCSSSSTHNAPPPPPPSTPAPAPSAAAHHSEVHVDRRVELVAIVESLAGAEEYQQAANTPYLADVRAAFGACGKHPAIAATRALREQHEIAFDAPMVLAVHLDDHFQPRGKLADVLPGLDARWKGVDLDAYAAQLRAFAADCKFDAFFAAHAAYYAAVENRMRGALDAENPAGWFDTFFGASPGARFVVVPGLLEGPSNYGVHTALPGPTEMYQVIGLYDPDAQALPVMNEQLIEVLVHEMAHSFVNPVLGRHRDTLVPAADPLFAVVAPAMQRQAYADTATMVNESAVRAVTVLYVRDRKGKDAADLAVADEIGRSFVWTPALTDLLASYRDQRARYKDFDAFVPELVTFFAAQAKRYRDGVPFLGTTNDVAEGDLVWVTPSDPALAKYATKIHDELFGKRPLVAASAHVLADHPHVGVVAYGSPATDPVIADLVRRAGWMIDDAGIALGGKHFTGPHLALIACWPRDDDPRFGIAVYAAAHDADLVGINGLRHGGTGWMVARRNADGSFEKVAAGNFPRDTGGGWELPK
ncbi:MAG TPA: DUF4932 domain-containing protein [Kofleriaceae bacterium]|nr:DUF4932 domain-containing protein [Kofleriaceae bacterium]